MTRRFSQFFQQLQQLLGREPLSLEDDSAQQQLAAQMFKEPDEQAAFLTFLQTLARHFGGTVTAADLDAMPGDERAELLERLGWWARRGQRLAAQAARAENTAVQLYAEVLAEGSRAERLGAIESMARAGGPAVHGLLRQLLDDSDEGVRAAATAAIEKLNRAE